MGETPVDEDNLPEDIQEQLFEWNTKNETLYNVMMKNKSLFDTLMAKKNYLIFYQKILLFLINILIKKL